jgi:uncharacterized membrane protein
MHRPRMLTLLISLALFAFIAPSNVMALSNGMAPSNAMAQGEQPPTDTPPTDTPDPALFTAYPSQVIGLGETANFNLKLRAGASPETLSLEMKTLPDGWTATFRGGGNIVESVYVEPGTDSSVELRLEPPADEQPGDYQFLAVASGANTEIDLPLTLTIKEKLPPKLSLSTELPTLKGTPTTTFRYSATLKNEGDEDLSVNLVSDAPNFFQVNFTLAGQDVTNIPLGAGESKSLSIEAQPIGSVPAGTYPINIQAQGGDVNASLPLMAEVTGQSKLTVTAPDGLLSGQAYTGRTTALKVTVQNTGSAPAQGIEMSSTEPTGWSIDFSPKQIPEIPAGEQVEVTANVRPADKAVAGDYMVTIQAKPADGATQSADFRITVLTSTLWGVVGIALIAVALGVVAIAVTRFGRR